jgi:hypothetical protein
MLYIPESSVLLIWYDNPIKTKAVRGDNALNYVDALAERAKALSNADEGPGLNPGYSRCDVALGKALYHDCTESCKGPRVLAPRLLKTP